MTTNHFRCLVGFAAFEFVMGTVSSASACTTVLVGKNASTDGSTMIARNEDVDTSWAKHYIFQLLLELILNTVLLIMALQLICLLMLKAIQVHQIGNRKRVRISLVKTELTVVMLQ